MGSLFGGKKTKFSKEETQRTMPVLPDFLQQPIQDLSGRINELSLQNYNPYSGQRLADFSGDQLAAFEGVRGLQGKYNPLLNSASTLAMDLGQGITPEDIQNFMNPYQQNVIDIAKRGASTDFDKQLLEIQNAQKNIQAFGGSRSAILESEARKNLGTLLSDIQTQGSSQGYQSALQAAMANQQLQQSSLAGMLNTASTGMGTELSGIEALRQTGAQQQALNQAGLDVNYGDFLEQRQWPYQQAQFAMSGLLPIAELTRGAVTKSNAEGSQKESGGGLGSALMGLGSLAMGGLGGIPGLMGAANGFMGVGSMGGLSGAILGNAAVNSGLNPNTIPLTRGGNLFKRGGLVRYAGGGPVTMGRRQPMQQFAKGSILDLLRNSAFSNIPMKSAEHFQSIATLLNPEMGKKPMQAIIPMFNQFQKHYSAPSNEPEEDLSKGYKMGDYKCGGLVKYAGGGEIKGLPPQTESISTHILHSIFKQSPEEGFETVKKFFGFGPQEYYDNLRDEKIKKLDQQILEDNKKQDEAVLKAYSDDPVDQLVGLWTLGGEAKSPEQSPAPEVSPEDNATISLQSLLDDISMEESGMPIFGSEHNDTKPKEPPVENRVDNYEREKAKRFGNFWTTVGSKILQTFPQNAGLYGLGAGVEAYTNSLKEEERYQAELEMAKQEMELKKLNAQSLGLQNEIALENLKFKKQSEPIEQKLKKAELAAKLIELQNKSDDPLWQQAVDDAVKMVEGIPESMRETTLEQQAMNNYRLRKNKEMANTGQDPLGIRGN